MSTKFVHFFDRDVEWAFQLGIDDQRADKPLNPEQFDGLLERMSYQEGYDGSVVRVGEWEHD